LPESANEYTWLVQIGGGFGCAEYSRKPRHGWALSALPRNAYMATRVPVRVTWRDA
jgi:hypothetical protein